MGCDSWQAVVCVVLKLLTRINSSPVYYCSAVLSCHIFLFLLSSPVISSSHSYVALVIIRRLGTSTKVSANSIYVHSLFIHVCYRILYIHVLYNTGDEALLKPDPHERPQRTSIGGINSCRQIPTRSVSRQELCVVRDVNLFDSVFKLGRCLQAQQPRTCVRT